MNYLKIVLQGYFNDNNREFLEKYFFREYKKAEKEQFFEADEFFNGCLKVIKGWEKYLQDRVLEQKRDLHLALNEAKNGTLGYANMEGKTIEQKRLETIEYCEQELNNVRPDGIGSISFTVDLFSLTNRLIAYNMSYSEVEQIKLSILKAFQKTQTTISVLNDAKDVQKSDFKTTYNEDLEKFLIKNEHYTEQDFINKCKLDFTELLNDAETKLKNPQFAFTSQQKMDEAPNNLIKSIKEKQKNRIVEYQSMLLFLEEKKNPISKTTTLPPQQTTKPKPELSQIWLSDPKITVDSFLTLGIEKGIWNEQYNIITAKGGLYGTGKSLLGNLSIALKGYAISDNTDYKEVGKAFCNTFNVQIKETIKEPYKAFSSGNEKQINLFKRAFNIR